MQALALMVKDKWTNLSRQFWIKASERTPCEVCQNYQVEEQQDHSTILGQYSINEVRQRKQQSNEDVSRYQPFTQMVDCIGSTSLRA